MFDYSYRFDDGVLMYGSLSGDINGDVVENVSNVQVFYSGGNIPGYAVFAAEFGNGFNNSSPVVSFDLSKNNFLFSNQNNGSGYPQGNPYLYVVSNSAVDLASISAVASTLNFLSIEAPVTENWSVNERWSLRSHSPAPSPVPDGGGTLFLLGGAFGGVIYIQRRGLAIRHLHH